MPVSAVPRRFVLRASRSSPFAAAVELLERVDAGATSALPVLMYHRVAPVGERPELDPSLLSATPEAFKEQVAFLAERRRPLSLDELLAVRAGEAPLPPRAAVVTFDDAYRDFAEHAWPILRRHGVPATVFVPTAYPDAPARAFWWDRLHAAFAAAPAGDHELAAERVTFATEAERRDTARGFAARVKALPHEQAMELVDEVCAELEAPPLAPAVLGWGELRSLAGEGVALAPHTRTHPLLNRLPLPAARDEIRGSADDLRRELGTSPPAFAYPAGGYSDDVVRILREESFALAFTIERGVNDARRANWLRLRRVNVGRSTSLPLLRAQFLPALMRRASAPGDER